MEIVVTTTAMIHAKLQSSHRYSFLQSGCTSCRPTNSVKALKGDLQNCHCNSIFICQTIISILWLTQLSNMHVHCAKQH